ncbi:MAG: VOC family protein [Actinomycetota bacterium]|nr:VOC family protein [Actinomycetota bacterium]
MSSVTPDRAPPEFEAATQVLVVSDSARSRDFYSGALGADVVSEYGGSSVVLRLAGAWLLLVAAGEPTPDKPTVRFVAPADPDTVSHEITSGWGTVGPSTSC